MHPPIYDLPNHRADDLAPRLRARGLPASDFRPERRLGLASAKAKHPPPAEELPPKTKHKGGFVLRLFRRRSFAPA